MSLPENYVIFWHFCATKLRNFLVFPKKKKWVCVFFSRHSSTTSHIIFLVKGTMKDCDEPSYWKTWADKELAIVDAGTDTDAGVFESPRCDLNDALAQQSYSGPAIVAKSYFAAGPFGSWAKLAEVKGVGPGKVEVLKKTYFITGADNQEPAKKKQKLSLEKRLGTLEARVEKRFEKRLALLEAKLAALEQRLVENN